MGTFKGTAYLLAFFLNRLKLDVTQSTYFLASDLTYLSLKPGKHCIQMGQHIVILTYQNVNLEKN